MHVLHGVVCHVVVSVWCTLCVCAPGRGESTPCLLGVATDMMSIQKNKGRSKDWRRIGISIVFQFYYACPIIRGIYIFLHTIFTRVVTEPSPLGEHRPRCSMTPITNKTFEKQNIFPMEFYNTCHCSIYNDHLLKCDTGWMAEEIFGSTILQLGGTWQLHPNFGFFHH